MKKVICLISIYFASFGCINDFQKIDKWHSSLEASSNNSNDNSGAILLVKDGLVGWWNLNSNLNDQIAPLDNGSYVNAPSHGQDRFSNASSALDFDNTGIQAASFGNATEFGADTFTVAFWFKRSSTIPNNTVLIRKSSTTNAASCTGETGWWFVFHTNGSYTLSWQPGSAATCTSLTTPPGPTTDGWYYLALVIQPNDKKIFLGQSNVTGFAQDFSAGLSANNAGANPLTIIGNALSIDDLTFYNRALSQPELAQNFKSAEQ